MDRSDFELMTKQELKDYAKSAGVVGWGAKVENNGKKADPTKEILINRIMDFLTAEAVTAEAIAAEAIATEAIAAEAIATEAITTEAKSEKTSIAKIYEFLGLSKEEAKEIADASKASGMSQENIIKTGILTRARKIQSEFLRTKNLSTEQLKNSTFIGAGHKIIKEIIDKIVLSNHAAYNNKSRIFINPSIVRKLTGCNLNSIKQVCENYITDDKFLESLDDHNARYELTNRDNKKGRDELGNRIKIEELIIEKAAKKEEKMPIKNEEKIMNYSDFAALINSLEDEQSIIKCCESLLKDLREMRSKRSLSASWLSGELAKYNKEIKGLKLKPYATYSHVYGSPRTLKDGELAIKGSEFNEEGKVVSEPRHIARKYLVLSAEEHQEKDKK
jgi:hypothetical protein